MVVGTGSVCLGSRTLFVLLIFEQVRTSLQMVLFLSRRYSDE